ncbi:MAG: histidine kinase dimerization/phospho-acceptor domain-containing protein, partial [Bacteroidota bacterium]
MDKSAPKRSLRAFILIGFILAISAVALMGYQAYNSVNNLARDLQAAADEDPYLTSLNRILNELTTAESDVRAYTITRDTETDLPESQTVINGIVQSLDELEAEFSDRRSFLEFQRLVEEKVEIMQELTTMVDTNQSSEVYDRFSIEVDRVVMESTPKPTSPTSQLRRLDEAPESITSQPEKPKEPEKELSPSEQRKLKRQKNREKGNLGKRILSRLSKEPDPIPELKVPEKQEVITQNPKQDTEAPQQRPNKPAKVAYRPEKVVEELQSSLTEIETEDYIARELIQGQIAELTEDGQEVMGEIKMMVRKLETKDSEKDLGLAINAEEQANETTRFIALFSSAVVLLCLILIAVIFGDMARNYRLQKRLQQEKSRAEILAKVKEDFLANMSHEIRTPMNAVIGFSEQLSQTSLSKKQNKLLQPVRNSAHYLLALINDILDYSKLESGNFKLEQSSFRPQSLLAEVLQTLQPLADKKQITLSGEGWEPIPLALQGDPLRLRQMLFNLIGNAIKFTEEGSVRLKAEIVSQK